MKQRLLEFRIWNLESKKWDNGQSDFPQILEFVVLEKFDCIIQQNTGIRDKNGVEIFEGDIIKGDWLPVDLVAQVYYSEDCCSFRFKGIKDEKFDCMLSCTTSHFDNLTVVGNIFENPELLK